jgi:hypothetical protein
MLENLHPTQDIELSNPMELIPSWEGNRFWANQEIPLILWTPLPHLEEPTTFPDAEPAGYMECEKL